MSLKDVKELGKNHYQLEMTIEKDKFDEAVTKEYKKAAPKITIPGFRKGKAPRSYVEKYYGKAYFYEGALDELVPDLYQAALNESGLEAVSRPVLNVPAIEDDGVTVTAEIWTMPVAEVKQYKGLDVARETVEVTDEDIEHEIMHARQNDARVLTVEGAAENGDEAVIDFECFLDGNAFEGGKGEKYPLKLGSGSFIPGFEEQIVGHSAGDEFDINVSFPADYGEASLAGKETVFKIKLHEVKRTELPELDDEFVKDVSDFDTVDEYKADIKAKIEARKNAAADRKYEEALLDALIANTEVEVPECMIDDEVDAQVRDFEYRLTSQGGTLDMYFKYTGLDMDKLKDSFKKDAERSVRARLSLKAVVKAENITASDEDREAEYAKIAAGYGIEAEQVRNAVPVETLDNDITMRKAMELIKETAAK